MKNLTINDGKYHESNTATASDAQGNLKRNPETVTHTSNGNSEEKVLSYQNIPVLPPLKNPGIDQCIAPIIFAPHTLLITGTKEVNADAASGGTWVNRNLRKVSRTSIDGSIPGNIRNDVRVVETSSPVLI